MRRGVAALPDLAVLDLARCTKLPAAHWALSSRVHARQRQRAVRRHPRSRAGCTQRVVCRMCSRTCSPTCAPVPSLTWSSTPRCRRTRRSTTTAGNVHKEQWVKRLLCSVHVHLCATNFDCVFCWPNIHACRIMHFLR
uniref:Uncharacterized protein n=1 Tax=Arundo donax TaxID=35708 RepID=A0A0A9KD49_ARUDO